MLYDFQQDLEKLGQKASLIQCYNSTSSHLDQPLRLIGIKGSSITSFVLTNFQKPRN